MEDNFIRKCITVRRDQNDFLLSERRSFKLSRFLQQKLDEYIDSLKEHREVINNG